MNEKRLNLGSCSRDFPGFTSVDLIGPADVVVDLASPWPWEDCSVVEIKAYDIIEHIGDCCHFGDQICERCYSQRSDRTSRQRAFRGPIHVMNELWRVLIPGGTVDIIVPTTDGRGAWQDPTHVSYWNRNSFMYYEAGNAHLTRFAPANGVRCAFRIRSAVETLHPDKVTKLQIVLEAVK
jgi:SAM-dependent methyltransferase